MVEKDTRVYARCIYIQHFIIVQWKCIIHCMYAPIWFYSSNEIAYR